MLQITDIRQNARVKVVNGNEAIAQYVYVIVDVTLGDRGIWLELAREDDSGIKRSEKPTDCVLA